MSITAFFMKAVSLFHTPSHNCTSTGDSQQMYNTFIKAKIEVAYLSTYTWIRTISGL